MAEAIAPANHTIPMKSNGLNSHEGTMTAEDIAALYFEQLDQEDVLDLYREVKMDLTQEI